MSRTGLSITRATALGALVLAVAACGGRQPAEQAAVEYKGTNPQAGSPAARSPQAATPTGPTGPGGIVSYEGYQAAVAREGDTVASVAQRLGLSASELGAYNGLTPDHRLRAGDELVLPPKPGGYGSGTPQQQAETGTHVARLEPLATPGTEGSPGAGGTGGFGTTGTSGVEATPLETAPPAASGEASGGWSAWSPDLAAQAIERSASPGEQGGVGAPPSSGTPLPPAPEAPRELASPELGQYQAGTDSEPPSPTPRPTETISTPSEQPPEQEVAEPEPEPEPAAEPEEPRVAAATPATGDLRLIRPANGPIVVGFRQGTGRARNDGVDFAAPAGSPVVAAAAGEVALVSQSLGGLGTIVLVRHPGDFLTVYGRVDRVTVQKGDIVSQGQKIGVVAPNATPRIHFEVRKGAESLDPERFLRG